MISKWLSLKPKSISLRKKGWSIRDIESNLSIPRSTLSGWFKNVELKESHKKQLKKKYENALVKARKKSALWHNRQKADRFKNAEKEADETLALLNYNKETIELALALLYLGEGFKKSSVTGMGNSDPAILKFFLKILVDIYKINIDKTRFDLHLRADQNPNLIKKFWSEELNVPIERFKYVAVDKRTIGRPTYPDYKGVCLINCGNVAIQRKLVYIGRKFCDNVTKMRA